MDEAWIVRLHEVGVMKTIPESEYNPSDYDVILKGPDDDLWDRTARARHYENLAENIRKSNRPLLPLGLCNACAKLTLSDLRAPDGVVHSETYWHLLVSAESCPGCNMLLDSLERAAHPFSFHSKMLIYNPHDLRPVSLSCWNDKRFDVTEARMVEVEALLVRLREICVPVSAGVLNLLENAESLPRGVYDLQSLQLLPRWHDEGHGIPAPASLPTRLLDLGDSNESYDGAVRLSLGIDILKLRSGCTSEAVSLSTAYAALSYRWAAPSHNLETKKQSLKSHQQGINFGELPKAIQDAVVVTRRLGIRYLWVDALCIIQDDPEDWSREASKMCEVYSNAFFTIAAHASEHADDGFLDKCFSPPPRVILGQNSDRADGQEGFSISMVGNSGIDVDETILSNRGWVLQERLLSRRILHFARNRIFWEDDEEIVSGDGVVHRGNLDKEVIQINEDPKEGVRSEECEALYDTQAPKKKVKLKWWSIVERYSRCQLTRPSDKLVAISGVVRQIQKSTNAKYLSGIWGDRFHQGILWLSAEQPLKRYKTEDMIIPTWSWGCVDGPIQYPVWNTRMDDSTIISEISVNVLAKPDMMENGSLFEGLGILRIQGAVKMGLRFFNRRVKKPNHNNLTNTSLVLLMHPTQLWDVHDDDGRHIGWASLDDDARETFDGNLEQLGCLKVASHSDDNIESGLVRGYLVLFVQRLVGDMCRRVGMGQIFYKPYFEGVLKVDVAII